MVLLPCLRRGSHVVQHRLVALGGARHKRLGVPLPDCRAVEGRDDGLPLQPLHQDPDLGLDLYGGLNGRQHHGPPHVRLLVRTVMCTVGRKGDMPTMARAPLQLHVGWVFGGMQGEGDYASIP